MAERVLVGRLCRRPRLHAGLLPRAEPGGNYASSRCWAASRRRTPSSLSATASSAAATAIRLRCTPPPIRRGASAASTSIRRTSATRRSWRRMPASTTSASSRRALPNCSQENLEDADFIVLHGVWSWVGDEQREQVLELHAAPLKPGGMVYLSYNCLPGLAQVAPLQRLLDEHANLGAGDRIEKVRRSMDFVGPTAEGRRALLRREPAGHRPPRRHGPARPALPRARVLQRQLVAVLPRRRGARARRRQARLCRRPPRCWTTSSSSSSRRRLASSSPRSRSVAGRDDQGLRAQPGVPPRRIHARRAESRAAAARSDARRTRVSR